MSNISVSIIIVTRGREDCLKPCLDSVFKQVYSSYEAIVIDNSLDSQFGRKMEIDYPRVKFCFSHENLFYCQALNKGISVGSGEFILCLNDDVVLDRYFLKESLIRFAKDGKIGMISGKILRSASKTIDSAGLFLSPWRTARERGYGRPDTGKYEREGYVFGACGAAAFYRRAMLEEVGANGEYFDSAFGIFYEDLDIAWRARNLGWRGYYVPAAVAYHARGATVRRDKGIGRKYARRYLDDCLTAALMRNRYLTIIKNESLSGFLMHLPLVVLYDFFAWIYALLFRKNVVTLFLGDLGRWRLALDKRGFYKRIKKNNKKDLTKKYHGI